MRAGRFRPGAQCHRANSARRRAAGPRPAARGRPSPCRGRPRSCGRDARLARAAGGAPGPARGAAPVPRRGARSPCRRSTAHDVAGVWARSTADEPSAIVPGIVASRCIQTASEGRCDGGAVEPLRPITTSRVSRFSPACQGRSKCVGPVADRLHDLPAIAARQSTKPLTRSTSCNPSRHAAGPGMRSRPLPALHHDETLEIIVIVSGFELVHRGAGGKVVLGSRRQPQCHLWRHPALACADELDPRTKLRLDLTASAVRRSGAIRSVLLRITRSAQASWSAKTSSSGLS